MSFSVIIPHSFIMYDFHFAAPPICIIRSRININTFERSLIDIPFDFGLGAGYSCTVTLRQAHS